MTFLHIRSAFLWGAALAIAAFAPAAQARHFQILHSFSGSDGSSPNGDLVFDGAGNLYGTAAGGGSSGHGTIFKLSPAGDFTLLYSFTGGSDGGSPETGLAIDPDTGDLYGTSTADGGDGQGGLFKLTSAGTLVVLHDFNPDTDGASPYATLTRDALGNFYGSTFTFGPNGNGTVFELTAGGEFEVLHAFTAGDGGEPLGRLALYGTKLYGTTWVGASGSGTIFQLDTDGTYTVLQISDMGEGKQGVVHDKRGNLYGGYASGSGLVYALHPDGTMSTLHTFDGSYPIGDLLLNGRRPRELYGVDNGNKGEVFRLDLKGNFTSLHTFAGAPRDGAGPTGGLVKRNGRLYGTTSIGGSNDMGIVFSVYNK
jgi:uncharacterized repeat protein (TIGR03803 family)